MTSVTGVPLVLKMGATVIETNAMMARGAFDLMFTNHNFQSEFDGLGYKVIARWAGEPIRTVIASGRTAFGCGLTTTQLPVARLANMPG